MRDLLLEGEQVLLQSGRAVSMEAPQVDVESSVIRTTSPDTQVRAGAICRPASRRSAAPCQHPPRKG